jgi:hypothetical protein
MFVLLEHTTRDGVHWDFIVEVAGHEALPTWRLLQNPLVQQDAIEAVSIAGHHRRFLDYEGPLREGRGRVRRLDRGEADVQEFDEQRLVAKLDGKWLRCRIELTRQAELSFVFRRIGEADPAAPA